MELNLAAARRGAGLGCCCEWILDSRRIGLHLFSLAARAAWGGEMEECINRMAWDLGFAGRAARTRKGYLADARAFLRFWNRPVEALGQVEVRHWVEHLLAAGTSPSRQDCGLVRPWLFTGRVGCPLGADQARRVFQEAGRRLMVAEVRVE